MSDETLLPDDEFEPAVKRYIAAGATEGARAAAQRLVQAVNVSLDEVATALQMLGAEASSRAVIGNSTITAAAALSGSGTLLVSAGVATGTGAALSGSATSVSRAEVTAAFDEIHAIREPDVETLVAHPPAKWSRRQVITVAVLLIVDVFLLLPPATQQYLLNEATLLVGIQAVVTLLSKPKS